MLNVFDWKHTGRWINNIYQLSEQKYFVECMPKKCIPVLVVPSVFYNKFLCFLCCVLVIVHISLLYCLFLKSYLLYVCKALPAFFQI